MSALTAVDLEAWRENRVLVLRGVFGPDDLAEMRAGCDALVRQASEFGEDAYVGPTYFNMMRDCDPFDPGIAGRKVMKGVVRRVTYPYAVSPVFNKHRSHPRLLAAVRGILGDDLVQIVNQVNFNHPGVGTGWGWHQDWRFRKQGLEGVGDNFVQTLAAIDHSGIANGGFRFVPGSFRKGPLALDKDPSTAEQFFDAREAVTPELAPGDVVFFNALTIHGSTANRSERQRRVFINGYARRSACAHGKPVMLRGRILDSASPEASPEMEFESQPAKLPLTSKY